MILGLKRIEDGNFGRCEMNISKPRLEAIP
jgi:RNA polymerase-binding transcription factor DksA